MNQQTTTAAAAIPSATQDAAQLPQVQENRSVHLALDAPAMDQMMRLADLMATASIAVPKHFIGKPGDCLAVIMQSIQWGMNPFAVSQKTHVVNGTLGYEAQLVNAVVQASGAINGRFHYEYRSDGAAIECRVGAVITGERDIVWNEWLNAASVTTKNSPLWKTNPKQQLGYLQVKNWARAYTPGAILGVYTPDELEEIVEREVEGEVVEYQTGTERLKAAATATGKAAAAAMGAARAAAQDTGPALADVLAKIAAMVTKDERKAALDLAKQLTNPADSESAATAYNGRLDWLKANPPAKASEAASGPISTASGQESGPATIDNETGEVSGQENARPVMTYAQVADALNKAANRDSFDVACDLIQYVADLQQREELGGIVKKRLEEFKAQ